MNTLITFFKYRKLRKDFPAWNKLYKLHKKIGQQGENKIIQRYLLNHPNDTIVRSKMIKNEQQFDDLLSLLKTLSIAKSQDDYFLITQIQRHVYPISDDIYDAINEIYEKEIEAKNKEYKQELSESFGFEI